MYKPIKNVYAYDKVVKKNEDRLQNEKSQMKVQCPTCGREYSFYAFEDKDRKLCKHCGVFVYKNDDAKKKYEELEKKRKQDELERMLKKYLKESNENVDRTKGRNVGVQRNSKNRKKTR